MGKLRGELVVGIAVLAAAVTGGGVVGVSMIQAANAEPAAVVETVEPVDYSSIPYTNGLADEQEASAAQAEAERIAAEAAAAEAARVAAEQAAADEAARVAAEQAAAEEPPAEEEPAAEGAPSGTPLPFYPSTDPENASGVDYADPAGFCASGSASTVGGVPTCD